MDASIIPSIPDILDAATAKRIKAWPHPSNRASEAGHPCARFLILSRVAGDKKALHDVGLQRIFDEGNSQEDAVMRELDGAGLRIIEQQRPFEWAKFQLSGRVDGIWAVNGDRIPLEIKSSSPNVFRTVVDMAPADMLLSKFSWIRKYPAQILLYMIMNNTSVGVMLFKNKVTGEKCQKIFILDDAMLEYAETILKKLEAVNAHVAAGTLPDVVQIDDCQGCPFAKTACFPGQDYGPGFEIMADAEIEGKLSRRGELEAAAKEYDEIDKEIKDAFRGRTAIVGDWKIESRPYEYSVTEIPKEVKAQYTIKKQGYRTSIERL